MTADSSSITVASTTPSQCKSNAALAYFASFGMGRGRRVSETADHSPAGRTPVVALFFRSPISAVARTSRRSSAHQPVYATQSLFAKFSDRREVCSLSISSEHGLGACTPSAAFSPLLRADPGAGKNVRLLHRQNPCVRKRLSFGAGVVASEFPAPAWRNWQTRWTQNPVIARSCGFEPLRRQWILNSMLDFGRVRHEVPGPA